MVQRQHEPVRQQIPPPPPTSETCTYELVRIGMVCSSSKTTNAHGTLPPGLRVVENGLQEKKAWREKECCVSRPTEPGSVALFFGPSELAGPPHGRISFITPLNLAFKCLRA